MITIQHITQDYWLNFISFYLQQFSRKETQPVVLLKGSDSGGISVFVTLTNAVT